ncbi:MAG: efflux RND transporter periplasmic adaptor subunit [Bacteroides sp.]|nr:efflux RND transporter periplasmic adaptor subunit [Bacteroidales bacterium]MBD5336832.1 efflux RND transporter periplasmic adaptor subunit [Bacteroides sp.]
MIDNRYFKVALCFVAGGALLTSCGKKQQGADANQQAPAYAVLTVGQSDVTLETSYPATLHGQNDVEIRPQVSGFLTKVHVTEGQHVSAGQVLFTIDQVQLQAAVDAARAQIQVAQANVNTAQTNANNNKQLFDKNIISASAYQTSVDALNSAKAALSAAKAQLVSAEKNLSYSVVKAPAPGVVGSIDFKEGALVSPSTLLTVLSNNGGMEAWFSMTEKQILAFTDGGRRSINSAIDSLPAVSLRLADGSLYPEKGKIVSISGVIDTSTGSATLKARFPNPDGMLRSGNTGQVLIPNVANNTIQIPQSATFDIQNMKFVYVLGDSSKIHTTPITVDAMDDGQNFIVTTGLKPGDVIVTEGVGVSLKDGMVITPKK